MGQYKVPQDVEAEDKILGPLTLKQFIYAVIGLAYGFLTFSLFRAVPVLFVAIGLPPTLLFLMLGLYQRQDQPFEALFLALLSYFTRPRKRTWEKEPIEEVFKLEAAPLKPEEAMRDPREVRGQLERLSQVVDTRGYSAKQATVQEPSASTLDLEQDRIAAPQLPQEAGPLFDVALEDDILDFQNNPNAANLNVLIQDSERSIREEALAKMKERPKPAAHSTHSKNSGQASINGMTAESTTGIIKLATENDDLTVSQLAAQARKQIQALTEGQSVSLRDASTTTS